MIAMSTLHTSCSVSVDPQQQALFAIQCLISPRKHRIMPLQAHRVNVTHLGTTRRSDEPARSVGHVVHTACCAQCVCKYNCFSQVDEPSTSYYASGMGLLGAPRPPNLLKPKSRSRLIRRELPSTVRRISSLDQAKLCDGILSRVHSPLGER